MGGACGKGRKARRVGDEFQANLINEHKSTELYTDTYEIGKMLGKGSYGVVNLARHKSTGRRVAIKTIKIGNGETWKELKNEVNIMKSLRHPNIVQLYETFSTSDTLHMVMAECGGGDLSHWLKDRMKASGKMCDAEFEKNVARFVVKTFSALAYMHDRNICHRDLKLDNLMLESSDPDAEVLVMDFGLGEIIQGKQKLEDASGTLPYMSPEVLDESIPYDYPCDIWATGVILYVLLAKELPFKGNNVDGISAEIKHKLRDPQQYMFTSPVWTSVSDSAKETVLALLQADHKKRPSAEQAQQLPWLRQHEDPKQKFQSFRSSQDLKPGDITNENFSTSSQDLITALRDFGSFQKLKQSALIAASFSLEESNVEVKNLRNAFNMIDTANNGRITEDELAKVFALSDSDVPEAEVKTIFKAMDQDGTGSINWLEFLAATTHATNLLKAQHWQEAFKLLDIDGSGFISVTNVEKVLGKAANENKAKEIVKDFDLKSNGVVEMDEFMVMMQQIQENNSVRASSRRPQGALKTKG